MARVVDGLIGVSCRVWHITQFVTRESHRIDNTGLVNASSPLIERASTPLAPRWSSVICVELLQPSVTGRVPSAGLFPASACSRTRGKRRRETVWRTPRASTVSVSQWHRNRHLLQKLQLLMRHSQRKQNYLHISLFTKQVAQNSKSHKYSNLKNNDNLTKRT